MKKVEFAGSRLSKLSFGTVQLGLDYGIANAKGKPTQETADQIIEYLIDSDVNCFDTAVAYGNSEEVLGHALQGEKDVHLISKVKSDVFIINLEKTILRSLQRLRTDTLFGLLLHDSELLPKWNATYNETVEALKKKGLIQHFGVSIYTAEEFDQAIENPTVEMIQIPFNFFDQRAINKAWFEKAKQANKLIFIRSIFLQGLFFMDPEKLTGNLTSAKSYLEEMHVIRKSLKLTISEFVMAYIDSVATDAIILFGCDTLDQAKENITSYNNLPALNKEVLKTINAEFSDIPNHIINPGEWSL